MDEHKMKLEEKRQLTTNIWKLFIYTVAHRRNFIPILSIYFLTLPNTHAQQIGLFTGIGFIFSFLFEIPSGYIADVFGHKRTLILSKVFMLLSTTSFIIGDSFWYFVAGAVFLNLGFAFSSGTKEAFMHETLVSLKRDNEYTKVMSKLSANASLISMALIMLLPLFTKISIILPLQINAAFDIVGVLISLVLVTPKAKKKIDVGKVKSIFSLIKEAKNVHVFAPAIFIGVIIGLIVGTTPFREVYLQSLGYPVIFIGLVMGLSRLVWFIIGHNAHRIEKRVSVKKLFFYDIFLFPLVYLAIAWLSHPYLVGLLFSLIIGYFWGRSQMVTNYFLKNYLPDKKYKATLLSIKSQVGMLFQFLVIFSIASIMEYSYKLGYAASAIILFVVLASTYPFIKK